MFQVIFHEEADREYIEAFCWYELQKTGLGDEFRLAVDDALQKITFNPGFFGFSQRPFREISVNRFPYTIVFLLENSKEIVFISAIYHTARNPQNKYRK